MKNIILILAGLAITAIGAQAQDSYYEYNSAGYMTHIHTPTYDTYIDRDSNGNVTYQHTNQLKDKAKDMSAVVAPTAVAAPAPVAVAPRAPDYVYAPVAPVAHSAKVEPRIIVIEGAMTPEQARRLVNGE